MPAVPPPLSRPSPMNAALLLDGCGSAWLHRTGLFTTTIARTSSRCGMGGGEALAGVAGLPAAAPISCPPARPPACPPAILLPPCRSALPSRLVPTSIGHCLPPPPPLQVREELAAAEARRPAVIAAQPSLRLNLPEALQQAPPRLDMWSVCARRLEQVGRVGWWCGSVWRRFSVRAQHGWRSGDHLHLASPESLPWLAWT